MSIEQKEKIVSDIMRAILEHNKEEKKRRINIRSSKLANTQINKVFEEFSSSEDSSSEDKQIKMSSEKHTVVTSLKISKGPATHA